MRIGAMKKQSQNKANQSQFQTRRRLFSASPLGDALRRSPYDCLLHKRLPRGFDIGKAENLYKEDCANV